MERFNVRINQEAGKPAPVVGGWANWGVLLPDLKVIEVTTKPQNHFKKHTFDNYDLIVEVDIPTTHPLHCTLDSGMLAVAVGPVLNRAEKEAMYKENILRSKRGEKPLRWSEDAG